MQTSVAIQANNAEELASKIADIISAGNTIDIVECVFKSWFLVIYTTP